jgi:pentatricopeptide repeat protein
MQRYGVVPDVITYSALISACEKGRQPERALELFEAMQRQGVVPDVITYSAMIMALSQCKDHQWEQAVTVLEQMLHDTVSIAWSEFLNLMILTPLVWNAAHCASFIAFSQLHGISAHLIDQEVNRCVANLTGRFSATSMNDTLLPWCQLGWGLAVIDESELCFSGAFVRLLQIIGVQGDSAIACPHICLPSTAGAVGNFFIHHATGKLLPVALQGSGWSVCYKVSNTSCNGLYEMAATPGLLHRLDHPSSGLLLACFRFQIYFMLKWHLNAYAIARDYSVICLCSACGWMLNKCRYCRL